MGPSTIYAEHAALFCGQAGADGRWLVLDRLGSVLARYYPYGEEITPSYQNREKFATYFRDSSGLDYARNRYYSSQIGRFLTPDPYDDSAGPENPGSWNRYAYVENDPVNKNDPSGLSPWDDIPIDRFPWWRFLPSGPSRGGRRYSVMNLREYDDRRGRDPEFWDRRAWELATDKLSEALSAFLAQETFSEDCLNIFQAVGTTIDEVKTNARHTGKGS